MGAIMNVKIAIINNVQWNPFITKEVYLLVIMRTFGSQRLPCYIRFFVISGLKKEI